MAHFTKVWPAGLTDGVSTLPHADLEALDTNASKAINGDDGGSWSPSSAVVVGGSGLARTMKSGTWDDFNADPTGKRTVVRRGFWTPAARIFVNGGATSWGIMQGNGMSSVMCSTVLLAPPDAVVLTNVRVYFKVVAGRASLPAVGPGLDISRYDPSASPPTPGQLYSGGLKTFTLPGLLVNYELGTTQYFDFVPDVNNTIDRTTYGYMMHLYDETGGGTIAGNLFYGYEATFTMTSWRP